MRVETCAKIYVSRAQSRIREFLTAVTKVRGYVHGWYMMHVRSRWHLNRRLNDTIVNNTKEVRTAELSRRDPMGPVNLNWEKLPKIYVVACTTVHGSHLKGHAGIPRAKRESFVPVRDTLIHVKSRLNKCCWTAQKTDSVEQIKKIRTNITALMRKKV